MRKTRSKKRTKIRVWLPSSPVRSGLKSRLPLSLGPRGPESSAPFICLHPHPHTMPHQRVCPVSGCWVGAQGRSPVFWNLLSLSAPSPACPPRPPSLPPSGTRRRGRNRAGNRPLTATWGPCQVSLPLALLGLPPHRPLQGNQGLRRGRGKALKGTRTRTWARTPERSPGLGHERPPG